MTDAELERQAHKAASRKLGFVIHLLVYLAVCGAISLRMALQARGLPLGMLLGWGFGLVMHGLVALGPLSRSREWLVARELAALKARSRP